MDDAAGAVAGARMGVHEPVALAPDGMETPTPTTSLPAPARPFFSLFFLLIVVGLGPDTVLLRTSSAAAPFNESVAIPSAIAITSSGDVRVFRSDDDETPVTPSPAPPTLAVVVVPAGVGVASIRGTST